MYAYSDYNYGYNQKKQIQENRKYLIKSVELGIDLMRNDNLSNELISNWLDYTEEVLKLCVGNSQSNIYIMYLEFKIKIESNNIQPIQKVNAYLEYLFEVLRIYN